MPNFSIVITVYNKELHIANTINSVLSQTVKSFEIIIVDDGSTDNSKKVLNSFKDPRITIYSIQNSGAAAARNFGIKKATNKLIALLDGDDYWHPFYLEEISLLHKLFPNEKIYATALAFRTKHHTYNAKYAIPDKRHQIINYFKGSKIRTLLSSSSVVIHQEVFDKVGYFDEKIYSGQDTDLWIRIGLHYPISFSKRVCVDYIDINNSLSNTTVDVNKKCRFDKFEKEEKQNPDLKQILDFNRFSLAILSKLNNDSKNYQYFKSKIDVTNLNWKQRLLLKLPSILLVYLTHIKEYLKKNKIILRVLD
ncbi:glycosyltransferase family 2 protein [Pseudofulvibacter geojedonensis]|uniref:Glycosyltransferase family 2 protein n=1 Tax=Pseudofulvibacter geojedonensis TaxID=1123758 RepID=A0ABW3I5A0_9FLAO